MPNAATRISEIGRAWRVCGATGLSSRDFWFVFGHRSEVHG
jgi:hypothetical protein